MKRIVNFLIVFVFIVSACTLNVPDLFGVRIEKIEYQDLGNLAIYLRNASEGYVVKVGDIPLDCSLDAEDPDLLVCLGPGFEPGDDLVIQFFDGDGDGEPIAELNFVAPDIPEEYKDSDSDGVVNTEDACPADPLKSAPGECGCGKVDTDSDGDGIADCKDEYPSDPNNADEPDETDEQDADEDDTDGDGVPDEEDQCPEDPDKSEPGLCGCGTADTDEDEDGLPDCKDECPDLAYQDTIGDPCDADEDNDGYKDGGDQCPYDPDKFTPGYCGCGNSEFDTDKDGYPDCVDGCPENPDKTQPDKDGCEDVCPVGSTDTDGDGTPDCEDGCPTDKHKTEPGVCGCGDKEDPVGDPCCHDEDGDGYDDWIDDCPYSVNKKHPGMCGCGCPENDPCTLEPNTDGDWFCDCWDDCPTQEGPRENIGCPL